MTDLFHRALQVLGKPEDCIEFQQLVSDLEPPVTLRGEKDCLYAFPRFGVGFASLRFESNNVFCFAIFYIDTPKTRAGESAPFAGSLPFGITTLDRRSDVCKKLGCKPESCQVRHKNEVFWEDRYSSPPLTYVFEFYIDPESLSRVLIKFLDDDLQFYREVAEIMRNRK
jgi:hypothetical protein